MPREMEVPYEKPGPPKGEAYGIAAVTQALEGTEFPASKQDLLNKAGNKTIEWEKGHEIKLRDIIQEAPAKEYPSMANVVSAVSDAVHKEKKESGNP